MNYPGMTPITTTELALQFLKDDQDDTLVDFVMERIATGEYRFDEGQDFLTWELRGDYRTLLVVSDESGVEVSDALMAAIYGTANPEL